MLSCFQMYSSFAETGKLQKGRTCPLFGNQKQLKLQGNCLQQEPDEARGNPTFLSRKYKDFFLPCEFPNQAPYPSSPFLHSDTDSSGRVESARTKALSLKCGFSLLKLERALNLSTCFLSKFCYIEGEHNHHLLLHFKRKLASPAQGFEGIVESPMR